MAKNTWVCSDLPAARKATKSRWVYTVKYKHDGTVSKRASFAVGIAIFKE